MRSLLLLTPLLTLSSAALAAPEYSVGVSGGAMVTDNLEVLGSTWQVQPRFGLFFNETLGAQVALGYQAGKTRVGPFNYTGLTPRVGLVGRLWTKGKRQEDGTFADAPPIQPLLGAGFGGFLKFTDDEGNQLGSDYVYNDFDFMVYAGPGLMVPLGKSPLHLRTDLNWIVNLGTENYQNRGDQFVNWEWTGGIGVNFGGVRDRDGDGIADDEDQCRDEPEDKDGWQDTDGCPDPDNDGDGLLDTEEECDNDPEDDDDFEDDDGCPDPDNDEDGILDEDDECPDVAGVESGEGCPDEDGDSVVDEKDECVDEAGSVEAFGCPDDDEDKVPNYRDDCPDEKGPAKADPLRSDGCPHKVFVTAKAIRITDKIFFDVGKATIKEESSELLTEIADTLKKYTGIKKVSIEGHTDNTGDPEANKTLSEERAAAVRTYLVEKHEIAEDRLESKGFGQEKPLVEGEEADTEEGRAQNRRVEFNITEQETKQKVLRRPKVEVTDAADDALAIKGLVVKKSPVARNGFVQRDQTCIARVVIDAEGKVSRVRVSQCVALARLATEKMLMKWEFEPVEVEGKATRVSTKFEVKFEAGTAKVSHRAKDIKPITE